jgi:hypothetical protein
MRLTQEETVVVREAEETRTMVMALIDRTAEPILVAQLLGSMGELYSEAAKLIATRARKEAKAQKKAVTP